MIEAALIWHEPSDKSHWDLEIARAWTQFSQMARVVGQAICSAHFSLPRPGRAFEIPQLSAAYV